MDVGGGRGRAARALRRHQRRRRRRRRGHQRRPGPHRRRGRLAAGASPRRRPGSSSPARSSCWARPSPTSRSVFLAEDRGRRVVRDRPTSRLPPTTPAVGGHCSTCAPRSARRGALPPAPRRATRPTTRRAPSPPSRPSSAGRSSRRDRPGGVRRGPVARAASRSWATARSWSSTAPTTPTARGAVARTLDRGVRRSPAGRRPRRRHARRARPGPDARVPRRPPRSTWSSPAPPTARGPCPEPRSPPSPVPSA